MVETSHNLADFEASSSGSSKSSLSDFGDSGGGAAETQAQMTKAIERRMSRLVQSKNLDEYNTCKLRLDQLMEKNGTQLTKQQRIKLKALENLFERSTVGGQTAKDAKQKYI